MRPLLRFPPPLHILVPMMGLACGFMYVLFKLLLVTEWGVERITETQADKAENLAQKLVEVMDRDESKRQKAMDDQLARAETYAAVNWAAVCDTEGVILHCTRPDWVGKSLSAVASPMAVEIAE